MLCGFTARLPARDQRARPGPDVTRRLQKRAPDLGQGKVTVTSGEVTVTAAARNKNTLQAGMCKAISDVRGYVGLQGEEARRLPARREGKAGKSEKRRWQPGMSKGMKGLAGYVASGGRDNWDL
jgi:hypothetical protein